MHRAIRTLPVFALSAVVAAAAHAQPGIGTCVMGETRSATFGYVGFDQYGAVVYQWIDPGTCGFCLVSDGAIGLRTVEIEVYTPSVPGPPINLGATVSVVGWQGPASCPEPDDAVVLIPPQDVTFVVPGSPFALLAVRAPIADSPQFLQPAFLRLEIPRTPPPGLPIALGQIASLVCTSCRQYEDLGYLPGLADACSELGHEPFVVRARGDCVAVTAARSTSWARVKAFYR